MDRPHTDDNIRSRKRQLQLKVLTVLLIILSLLYAFYWFLSPSVYRENIRTAKVERGTITATINAGGIVVPMFEETLSSELKTQIIKVIAQAGQTLKKGDVILQLDTRNLELAMGNLTESIAVKDTQIKARQLNLIKLVNDLNAKYQLLSLDLESWEMKTSEFNQLNEIGAIPEFRVLEARLNVKKIIIQLRKLQQSITDLKSATQTEITGLELEQSILEKQLQQKQRLFSLSTVKATRDGVLSWVNHAEGVSVNAGEPIAKIADNNHFRIEATLSDFYAAQLRPGMKAEVLYNHHHLKARLETLIPTIENGVMKLMISLDQVKSELLRPNLRVDVGLITDYIEDAYTLSKGPFVNGAGLQQAFVIKNNMAYKTQINIGLSNSKDYQILNGLDEGDEIIISDVSDFLHLNQFSIN